MSKYIYVLANFNIDNHNHNVWMTSVPFIEQHDSTKVILTMLRDTNINFLKNNNDIIKFTLYKIKVDNIKEYLIKRSNIFIDNNFSPSNIQNYGFVKLNDFEYIVDENNKTQISNGFNIQFCYDKHQNTFGNKIYLSCPTITFNYC